MKDNHLGGSEAKYKKATDIIDRFKGKGDIYCEKYEDKLIKQLELEIFRFELIHSEVGNTTGYQRAQEFLEQYQSYLLMKQGMAGAGGANSFYYGIGEVYFNSSPFLKMN